jgi:hypothetical protein
MADDADAKDLDWPTDRKAYELLNEIGVLLVRACVRACVCLLFAVVRVVAIPHPPRT